MVVFEFSAQIIYTIVLFVLAGMALTIYFALFYLAMISLDGCAICKWIRSKFAQKAQGQSLSRT